MELHAEDVVALDRRAKRVGVLVAATQSSVTGAAYECVKYTCAPLSSPRSSRADR
jgi:hypothetical protein